MGWGGAKYRGGKRNRTTREGGAKFWMLPEGGGRKILDFARRGGRKILDLINFFFNVPKTQFFHVLGVFWALFIFWSKGGRKILDASRRGGEKF